MQRAVLIAVYLSSLSLLPSCTKPDPKTGHVYIPGTPVTPGVDLRGGGNDSP